MNEPTQSPTAVDLLRAEAERLGGLRTSRPIHADLRWAYSVAAAWLDCREKPKLHPLVASVLGDVAHLPFEPGAETMGDGWYLWRLKDDWPVMDYRVLEVAGGSMIDTEPVDEHGGEWLVCEEKPYGQFFGPILLR